MWNRKVPTKNQRIILRERSSGRLAVSCHVHDWFSRNSRSTSNQSRSIWPGAFGLMVIGCRNNFLYQIKSFFLTFVGSLVSQSRWKDLVSDSSGWQCLNTSNHSMINNPNPCFCNDLQFNRTSSNLYSESLIKLQRQTERIIAFSNLANQTLKYTSHTREGYMPNFEVYRWLAVVIYILDSRRSAHACLCTHSRIFSFQL